VGRFFHRRPSASLVVAFAALFVSLAGVGYAATGGIPGSNGVIHSCYQKSHGALRVVPAGRRCRRSEKSLAFNQRGQQGPRGFQGARGLQGKQGKQGVAGKQGKQGVQGPIGPAGPLTTTLPHGQTLRGWLNIDTVAAGANQIDGGSISFALQTASAPTVQIVPVGGPTTAACAGSVAHPSAAAGFMCVYESTQSNVASVDICSSGGCGATPGADPFGAEVSVHSAAAGRFTLDGTWAVTGA
jgi:hypothetical protein